ncbi:hypothetical protein [Gracilibacillus boraciitolerans]|uniref:hypothetical protein n=1 Tax=Gracilibacillus boraciitolerans TaxID=307521 RepID=UPI000556B2FA|nr:hypothetical protein [Gracilibacillus boraciitolerans]
MAAIKGKGFAPLLLSALDTSQIRAAFKARQIKTKKMWGELQEIHRYILDNAYLLMGEQLLVLFFKRYWR